MARIIDIHTHVVPESFPLAPESCRAHWPCMARDAEGGALMTIGDRPFRRIDARAWDVDERLAAMTAAGVSVHVLSPMPELFSYWLDADDALPLMRHVNRTIGAMVARAPASFVGLGAVPLQDPVRAVTELDIIKNELGLAGIEVGASINGRPLGDPAFRPVLARAAALGLAVFVHSVRPPHTAFFEPQPLFAPTVGYPLDMAMAAASLIAGGVMRELPGLRIAFAHGGGAFVTVLPRLVAAWTRLEPFRARVPDAPAETAKRFFYDSLVYEPALLAALIALVGADRICLGTDEPFDIRERRPLEFIGRLGLPRAAEAAVLGTNAEAFLSLPA